MYKRMAIATVGLMVLLSTSVPVFAQNVREFFGPPVPLAFDSEGGRHWREYCYSGPWVPPLVWKKGLVVVAPSNPARSTSIRNHSARLHAAALSKDHWNK